MRSVAWGTGWSAAIIWAISLRLWMRNCRPLGRGFSFYRCAFALSRGRHGDLALAGGGILSIDPTAVAALQAATSADANDRTLSVKRAVVDAIFRHGVDLLRP